MGQGQTTKGFKVYCTLTRGIQERLLLTNWIQSFNMHTYYLGVNIKICN